MAGLHSQDFKKTSTPLIPNPLSRFSARAEDVPERSARYGGVCRQRLARKTGPLYRFLARKLLILQ
jgi:hypothetical protein